MYQALACDYDGTLASEGRVPPAVRAGLERLRASGCKLLLVTGRRLDHLLDAFPAAPRFDRIVAENGALLYAPATGAQTLLADPLPLALDDDLRARGVAPVIRGAVIVATDASQEAAVRETLRRHGLALSLIFNKDALMLLPPGVDKGTGLLRALADLGIAPADTVGVGDAENDEPLLAQSGYGVALANAVPALAAAADWVTPSAEGKGVLELVEAILGGGPLPRTAGRDRE